MRRCRSKSIVCFMTRRSSDIAPPGFTKSSDRTKVIPVCKSMRRIVSTARRATSRIRRRISIGWCLKVAVGRTIRTCSVLALVLMAGATAETAAAARDDLTPWRAYVRGRAAISEDRLTEASHQFQIALKASANDRVLRQRTFGLALLAEIGRAHV